MKTCGECDAISCPYRGFAWTNCQAVTQGQATTNEQIQVKNEMLKKRDTFDWKSFRRDAAKDILAGILANPNDFKDQDNKPIRTFDEYVDAAINSADMLIAKLREGEK